MLSWSENSGLNPNFFIISEISAHTEAASPARRGASTGSTALCPNSRTTRFITSRTVPPTPDPTFNIYGKLLIDSAARRWARARSRTSM